METKIKYILYADDDSDEIELVDEAINKVSDMKMLVARDGRQLIRSLNELPLPDFILLDLYMPYFNGKECIKAIRNVGRYDTVPVSCIVQFLWMAW